jgi:prevent-host-death family protein
MRKVNACEARSHWSKLLAEAERGEVISITRYGREVARLVPPESALSEGFPDLSKFRKSIKVKGRPTSSLVIEARRRARY